MFNKSASKTINSLEQSLEVILFENDKLFPLNLNLSMRNYDILTFNSKLSHLHHKPVWTSNQTCSQLIGLRSVDPAHHRFELNITIEIHLPTSYTRLLKLMYAQLSNSSSLGSNMVDRNLFDYVFNSAAVVQQQGDNDDEDSDEPSMIISDGQIEMVSDDVRSALLRDERTVRSERTMAAFRDDLVNKWLQPSTYEVVYSELRNLTQNNSYFVIDWTTHKKTIKCHILVIDFNWVCL